MPDTIARVERVVELGKRSSLALYRLKKAIEELESKQGHGTQLVSLLIPPGKQVSDVLNVLKQEYSTAANIKSKSTRKNVQDSIMKAIQRLKLFNEVPPTGLIIYSGAIPRAGPGTEEIETYVIIPPEPINTYLYRCDDRFYVEPLKEMLREQNSYGILVMDNSEAVYALLRGRRLEILKKITSGVPGKTRAGGQSARRFERLREAELNEYYKRVASHAEKLFLDVPDLRGIIVGGPGPTKYEFVDGGYLHYMLKDKILAVVDTSYADEQGVREVFEKAPEVIQSVRYVEERNLVQRFLSELGRNTGYAIYGEQEVRDALLRGAVKTLLLSEDLDLYRVSVKCPSCGYVKSRVVRQKELLGISQKLEEEVCPKCGGQGLQVTDTKSLIDEFAELAEASGAEVEIISAETEEGAMLKNAFGGIAAILRYKQP